MLHPKFLLIPLFICVAALASCEDASMTAKVVNYEASPISTNNHPAEQAGVKRAILIAGSKLHWQMQPVDDGHIVATLMVRKHIAKVDITYTSENYSITYKDSTNLMYDGKKIHSQYNNWVDVLHRQIRVELSNL
jgi:hypothetical protein